MGTHIYPLWNQVPFYTQLAMLVLTSPLIFIPTMGYFAVNRSKHSYLFVQIFKMLLPPFLGNLQLFALQKWFALQTGLINKNG